MSRHAAATSAGRAHAVRRTAKPPLPRRVSGPAAPPRGDDGRPSREPRARIDPAVLAVAGGAVADRYGALPARRSRPLASADGAVVDRYGALSARPARALAYADGAVVDRYGALPARRPRTFAAPRPARLAYGGVAIASRVAGVALDVSASRMMDRVVRGRAWIGVIAFSLIGLVAMQVSLLKLNSGIGRAAETVSTLERSNSSLRSDITGLGAGDRIQRLAEAEGFVMPAPGDVAYLRSGDRHGDAVRAARRMQAPDPAAVGFAGSAIAPNLDAGVTPPSGLATTTSPPGTTAGAPDATTPAAAGTASTAGAAAPAGAASAGAATPTATAPGTTGTTPTAAIPATTATAQPAGTQPAGGQAAAAGGASQQVMTQAP
jgi:hypothetical protein